MTRLATPMITQKKFKIFDLLLIFVNLCQHAKNQFIPSVHPSDTVGFRVLSRDWPHPYLTIPTHPKKVSAYPRVPALTEITFLNTSSHHYNISKYLAYLKTGLYLSNILGDLIFLEKSLGLKRLNTFKNWFHEILLMERRKYKVKLLVQQITRNYLIEI